MEKKKPKLPTYEVEFIPVERRLVDRREQNMPVAIERRKQRSRRNPQDDNLPEKDK
jgi:hypothetical protein